MENLSMKNSLFSDTFSIKNPEKEDWYNPILFKDVELFIDPLLVTRSRLKDFKNSNDKIYNFFRHVFELVIKSEGNKKSGYYKLAISSLQFPEVSEIYLGYSKDNSNGAGTGSRFGRLLYDSINKFIGFGLLFKSITKKLDYIDILNIFVEGLGHDRMSDITANIIKEDLIKYTQTICKKYKIKCELLPIRHYKYDKNSNTWIDGQFILPKNPNNGRPILLVPKRFLRRLPSLNDMSFITYLETNASEDLRKIISSKILKDGVNKSQLLKLVEKYPEYIINFMKEVDKNKNFTPYDIENDPDFVYSWITAGRKTIGYISKSEIKTQSDVTDFLKRLCNDFKNGIENKKGHLLLWSHDSEKPCNEKFAQNLFNFFAINYCKANNVDISKEVDVGRGVVDFKFSFGYSIKVLLEIKLAGSTKFMDGLQTQLTTYMKSEGDLDTGFYMLIVHKEKELERADKVKKLADELKLKKGLNVYISVIDARLNKPSASRLK